MKVVRLIINTNYGYRNFLKLKETQNDDIIVATRGLHHRVGMNKADSKQTDLSEAVTENVTIHPNLNSQIGSISVHYKDKIGGVETKSLAGVLGVRKNVLLFPIISYVGENISVIRLAYDAYNPPKGDVFELWEPDGIDLSTNSLAYILAVCNRDLKINFPRDFPRNIKYFRFKHLKLILFYWLFNQPTKFRGTSLRVDTHEEYLPGLEVDQLANLTNQITMKHCEMYPEYPNI